MSISQNYPIVSPSLSLDFSNTKVLDSRITFSRPTSAVYYDGQTVTKAEENLLLQSQAFNVSPWSVSNTSITANTTTAPDGTTTADLFTATGGTAQHASFQLVTGSSGTYAISVFAKPNTTDFIALEMNGGTTSDWAYAVFDVNTGVVGNTGAASGDSVINTSITNVGGGWYRCVLVCNVGAVSAVNLCLSNSATPTVDIYGRPTFTPAGTPESSYFWGAQLEQRDTVTAYQLTTTQPITNYIPTLLTAPANSARFDHNPVTGESLGLLVEEQRTNLSTYSEDFADASWTKGEVTVQSNVIIAPDGSLTGDLLNDASISYGSLNKSVSLTNSAYTFSVYIKSTTVATNVRMDLYTTTGEQLFVVFNSATGAYVSGSAVIYSTSSIGNGWYRIALSATGSGTTFARIYPSGDSAGATGSIYIWGAQLEAGSFPTSYIKTEASQVTRSADSASMTGANFSDWYRQDEGSFYAEAMTASNASSDQIIFGIIGTSLTNGVYIVRQSQAASGTVYGICNDAGLQVALLNLGTPSASTEIKTIMAYKTNDFAGSLNSATVVTDTLGRVSQGVTVAYIGSSGINQYINSTIKKIAYFPARLSNEELQEMTS